MISMRSLGNLIYSHASLSEIFSDNPLLAKSGWTWVTGVSQTIPTSTCWGKVPRRWRASAVPEAAGCLGKSGIQARFSSETRVKEIENVHGRQDGQRFQRWFKKWNIQKRQNINLYIYIYIIIQKYSYSYTVLPESWQFERKKSRMMSSCQALLLVFSRARSPVVVLCPSKHHPGRTPALS